MFITIARSLLMEPPEISAGPVDLPTFWWKIIISVILVLAGGVFAGSGPSVYQICAVLIVFRRLTLGLMGLDELHLRVLATSSEDLTEKRNAQKGAFESSLVESLMVRYATSIEADAKRPALGISGTLQHNAGIHITVVHTYSRFSSLAMSYVVTPDTYF